MFSFIFSRFSFVFRQNKIRIVLLISNNFPFIFPIKETTTNHSFRSKNNSIFFFILFVFAFFAFIFIDPLKQTINFSFTSYSSHANSFYSLSLVRNEQLFILRLSILIVIFINITSHRLMYDFNASLSLYIIYNIYLQSKLRV